MRTIADCEAATLTAFSDQRESGTFLSSVLVVVGVAFLIYILMKAWPEGIVHKVGERADLARWP